jgi:hypothetical protein
LKLRIPRMTRPAVAARTSGDGHSELASLIGRHGSGAPPTTMAPRRQELARHPCLFQFVGGGCGKRIFDLLVHVREDIEEPRRHLPLFWQSEGALEDLKRGGVWFVEHREPNTENDADEQRRQRTQISVTEAPKHRSQRMAT